MYYWAFLVIAILTEVSGTLAMKYSVGGARALGLGVMYFMLVFSYASLAIAVKRIPLVVAYGAWESFGLVLIALLSHVLFDEPLGMIKIFAIVVIISGILLLERGTFESTPSKESFEG